jgi:hypothetical protein
MGEACLVSAAVFELECVPTVRSKLSLVNGLVRYSSDPTMRPRARSNNPSFDDNMTTGVAIAVQTRHHDVAENDVGLMIGNLRQCVESVFGEDDLTAGLYQKNLGTSTNGVGIVDDHYLQACDFRFVAHDLVSLRAARITVVIVPGGGSILEQEARPGHIGMSLENSCGTQTALHCYFVNAD